MVCSPNSYPYYLVNCGIQEGCDHLLIALRYSGSFRTTSAFNMPLCGSTATVQAAGMHNIAVGTWIWNPVYGYLEVVGFNAERSLIILKNYCHIGNASVGTHVPDCTLFVAIDSPCCFSSYDYMYYPYLAVDFLIPAVGACVSIKVTTVAGLVVGQYVSIDGNVYYINAVLDATTLTICNYGAAIPNTVVRAKDSAENYIVPLIMQLNDICESDTSTIGALTCCYLSSDSTLRCGDVNDIPVLVNAITGAARYMDFGSMYSAGCCYWDLSDRVMLVAEVNDVTGDDMPGHPPTYDIKNPTDYAEIYSDLLTVTNDTCKDVYLFCIAMFRGYSNSSNPSTYNGYANFKVDSRIERNGVSVATGLEQREMAWTVKTTGIVQSFEVSVLYATTVAAAATVTFQAFSRVTNVASDFGANAGQFYFTPGNLRQRLILFGMSI